MLPPRDQLTICFAHVAYGFQDPFTARATGMRSFQVWSREDLAARIPEADVVVVSGFWDNDLLATAAKLRLVQSISAGTDQYDQARFREAGVRLASAAGGNARAVSEHAMALILALARRLPEARDNQHKAHWRGMIGDFARREDELGGKTVLIVGLGRIGSRLAQLCRAFDMTVIGIRQNPAAGGADEVHGLDALPTLLPRADIVALTCPLTPATEGLMNAAAFGLMRRSAHLINCARGRVVDEAALVAALQSGAIAAAGIDVTVQEPLAPASALWALPNVLITPHSAGETRRYEANVMDMLMENLQRLWRGEAALLNQVV
jgi:phosphoglycerate dehydrogenase-like enzyme